MWMRWGLPKWFKDYQWWRLKSYWRSVLQRRQLQMHQTELPEDLRQVGEVVRVYFEITRIIDVLTVVEFTIRFCSFLQILSLQNFIIQCKLETRSLFPVLASVPCSLIMLRFNVSTYPLTYLLISNFTTSINLLHRQVWRIFEPAVW